MAYRIVYKAYAERDMWEIAEYLSEHSIPAMQKFMREVRERIERLKDMPLMCPKIEPALDYRKMVVGKYVVVYIVNERAKQILILRVVHGKRNYHNEFC